MDLIDEYRAAERADYVTYGGSSAASTGPTPQMTAPPGHAGPDSPLA